MLHTDLAVVVFTVLGLFASLVVPSRRATDSVRRSDRSRR